MTSTSVQASTKKYKCIGVIFVSIQQILYLITYCHHNIHLLYVTTHSHIFNYIYTLYKQIMVNYKKIHIKINSQTTFYFEDFRMNLNKDSADFAVEFCSMPLFIICIAKSARSFQSYPVLIPVADLVT